LPIVSLSTDKKYLFDDTVGIYVEGTNGVPLYQCKASETENKNYAQEWERPMYIEYFDKTHAEQFSFGLDVSISWQCSRHIPKKSFKFELDSKYGVKKLEYKLYPTKDINVLKDFKLKPGHRGFEIGEILTTALIEDGNLSVDYQAYRAVQMFMNGDYWGVYNLREAKGTDYLKSNYPEIDDDSIDIIKINYDVKAGDMTAYRTLGGYIREHDLSKDADYQEILTMVDKDSFIDYMSIMIYSGNDDWIYSNNRCWREQKDDAKWRWMIDDVDRGFQEVVIGRDNFDSATKSGLLMTDLFIALLKNSTFKSEFKSRFDTLLSTTFSPTNVELLVDKIVNEKEGYMDLEKSRWGIDLAKFQDYETKLRLFIAQRSAVVKTQLDAF